MPAPPCSATRTTRASTDDTVIRCAAEEEATVATASPGGRGCDGFDRRDGNCPEGTLAVGALVHEAVIREGSDGAELVKIEILT